jgi:hypothetical protein
VSANVGDFAKQLCLSFPVCIMASSSGETSLNSIPSPSLGCQANQRWVRCWDLGSTPTPVPCLWCEGGDTQMKVPGPNYWMGTLGRCSPHPSDDQAS